MTKYPSPTQAEKDALRRLLRDECSYAFDEDIMDSLLSTGTVRTLARGESLIDAGQVDRDVYFIMDGITRHWYWNGEREKTAFFSQSGTMLVSYHSYYLGKGSFYNIEACCPTRILCLKKSAFDRLISSSHDFAQWCLSMAQCQIFFFEMKNRVISGTAKERYISFLKNRPDILRRVQLKVIASYLDVTPQYLSKLRKMKL